MSNAKKTSDAGADVLEEDDLIALFAGGVESSAFDPTGPTIIVGNGDDAAVWQASPGMVSVISTDSLFEGVHFDLAWSSPRDVGRKLMAVNLSDLAAMGAAPRFALISVAFPKANDRATRDVASEIASGIHDLCRKFGVVVLGGNVTASTGPIVLTATVIGESAPEHVIQRRGAQPHDALFVTGSLGDARAGLEVVLGHAREHQMGDAQSFVQPLLQALCAPNPRLEAGRVLASLGRVHAMCDVSDGLGRDLRRLLAGASLGAKLWASAVPVSSSLRKYAQERDVSPVSYALAGGEDYELLFSASPEDEGEILRRLRDVVPVARIGTVTSESAFVVVLEDGRERPLPLGYDHFGGEVEDAKGEGVTRS